MDVKGNELDTAMIGQDARHEMGLAIGLGDANFNGIFFHGRKGQ
ncbi:hypothetical protein BH18THE2_BH18THE2_19200 [soil metagenome]